MRTPVIAIDCWHKGCDFSELIQGRRAEGDFSIATTFMSSDRVWYEHNRKVHGRG